MKRKVILEIEVKDSVENKYPNYKANFADKNAFIDFLISNLPLQETAKFGYTVKIKNEKPRFYKAPVKAKIQRRRK